MTRWKQLFVFIIVSFMLLGGFPFAAFGDGDDVISQSRTNENNNALQHFLNGELSQMIADKQVKGAVVSVVSNNETVFSQGYGWADEENGVAVGEKTGFRIGSISKTFVAVAAQKLAEQGKLEMHNPIMNYLETDFPRFKYDITMHQLLTHTAGFEDILSGIVVSDPLKAESLALSIRKYKPAQVFEPGEVVSYSNYGIALAAYVVEQITGQDFYQYAEDNIFKPLGMNNTTFKLDDHRVAVSKAYAPDGKETFEPFINLYPEGSVVATANDMEKYMQWLVNDSEEVLSREGKRQLFRQQFTMSEEFAGMGYTWSRKDHNGEIYYDKKGETLNFYSRIALYPQQKTAVFLCVNTYVAENELNALMNGVADLLLGNEKQPEMYTGKQTADISGVYVSTRSSFETVEKVMNFIIPGRIIYISGNLSKEFNMNGEKLLPIGENHYLTPIGEIKWIQKNDEAYLANPTAISYVRAQGYENNGTQVFIVAGFALISFIMLGLVMVGVLRRNRFLKGLTVIQFALFLLLCLLIFHGLSHYNFLSISLYIQFCAILIIVTSVSGILFTGYRWMIKDLGAKDMPLIVWNISSVLFSLWMVQVNIL